MNDLVVRNENSQMPAWFKPVQGPTGTEALGQGDFKIPRISLLQAMNPECRKYAGLAIPGNFWHSGMNVSLGNKFTMVSALVKKRVILFKPRHSGGGVIASSRDGVNWDVGGNKKFLVNPIKDDTRTVTWDTGRDVKNSRLLEFGSSIPDNDQSAPAATLFYEYLVCIPEKPELSPVLYSMAKTALPTARALNSYYKSMSRRGIPTSMLKIEVTVQEKNDNDNSWYIPVTRGIGMLEDQQLYISIMGIAKEHSDYQVEYEDDSADVSSDVSGDKIAF